MIKPDPANILMVDDQFPKLMSYEAILSDLGENLIKATSAREALDKLLRNDIAVVLMDVSMPEMDGFELADMMHRHPRFQKTAIIFISAVHLTDMDRIRGYRSGAVDYLSVPVVPELLRAKVGVFAELHRKGRQLEQLNRDLEKRVEERTVEVRRLNSELEQRVAELMTIMQVLPVGVAVAQDRACDRIFGNQAMSDLLGLERGANLSATGAPAGSLQFDLYRDGKLLRAEELPLQMASNTGKPVANYELQIRRHNGLTSDVVSSAAPLFGENGETRGAVGAFFDLSSQRRQENLLREQHERFQFATAAAQIGYWFCDLPFDKLAWDACVKEHFWLPPDAEVDIDRFYAMLHPDDREPTRLAIESSIANHARYDVQYRTLSPDGRQKWIHAVGRTEYDGSGAPIRFDGITRDITQQVQAEHALRHSERLAAMGRVAGIIAHEINNPLESITNTFYLLRDHPSLDEEARYYARLGEEELQRVSHITRQTLGFYRESKDPISVSLSEVLDDILDLQRRRLNLAKITVEKRYTSRGFVQGFPVEIKQVFLNLIGNAVQAMPRGGTLRLRVAGSGAMSGRSAGVLVSIIDTGTGIDREQAKHLFQPFFTTKSSKGTGLGLWISRGIVQKYGGSIRFRSLVSPGGNVTCFQVFFPGARSNVPSDENQAGVRTGSPELIGSSSGRT